MRYSIEPRERRYVIGYGFLSFARNIGTHATKVAKNRVINMVKNLLIMAKKSATDAIKVASKRSVQKTAEATAGLVGIKIADKIASTSKKSLKKPRDQELLSTEVNKQMPKERHIYLQKKNNKLLMN